MTAAPVAPLQRQVASSYDAPPGCPTHGDYVQYVESRSANLRLFAEPAAVQTSERVRVRIQPEPGTTGWLGALVIEGDAPLEREVRGARCEDVVLALALITVLRLEPERQLEVQGTSAPGAAALAPGTGSTGAGAPGATPSATAERTPATPATPAPDTANPAPTPPATGSAPAAPAPTATEDAAEDAAEQAAENAAAAQESASRSPTPAEPAASTPATEAPPAPAGSSGTAAAAAAQAQSAAAEEAEQAGVPESAVSASTGVSDSPAVELSNAPPVLVEPALAAYVGYASSPSHAFGAMLRGEARLRPGVAAWATAASLAYAHSSQQNPAGDLDFDSLLAGLSLCPPGLRLSVGLWLQACGEARAGVLAISATERELPLEGSSNLRPWFELGPSLQAGLPLSSGWSLRALSSVTLVLMRDSFDVERIVVDEDGQEQKEYFTLYRPPVASFQFLLGVGYEF